MTVACRQTTLSTVAAGELNPDLVKGVVRIAVGEDLAGGTDVTSVATIPVGRVDTADLVARADGVVAGLPVAAAVFHVVAEAAAEASAGSADPGAASGGASTGAGAGITVREHVLDGSRVHAGDVLLTVTGPTRVLLSAERTALNLLCHLSGVATLTRAWVDAVATTAAAVRDTRKTLPGLRALEKYAVRCGGGVNHRMALSDAALVKDNHVLVAGGVAEAFDAVRRAFPELAVEVECDTLAQVSDAIRAGADLILLDNMRVGEMRRAVELARPRGVRLEASGRLSLEHALEVAQTGVDFLAVGALTHSAPAFDVGMDLRPRAL